MKGKYQCTLSKIQCLAKAQGIKEWRHAEEQRDTPTDSSVAKLCSFRNGVDFRGGKTSLIYYCSFLYILTAFHGLTSRKKYASGPIVYLG